MSLKIAIQMDPIETIDIGGDSTFVLALEAQKRGYELFHYLPRDMSFREGKLHAVGHPLSVRREVGNHYTKGGPERVDLAGFDVILMRQDPPFDMSYITATHLLEHVQATTLVVNDPANVRNAPEKLLVTHFPELMPPTLITRRKDEIMAFRDEFKDIIIKPLFGNGGAGVFRVQPGDENISSLIELFEQLSNEPLICQKYLPEVRKGDKRIILVDGEVAGAINRVPAQGEARSNLHVGGTAQKTELTPREREICDALRPVLKSQGLIFTGIDVIGDYLTEINVTSPTGLVPMDRFNGTDTGASIWDAIERRL